MDNETIKQAIVIRTDLGMGRGKLAAQACHASLEAYKKVKNSHPEIVEEWENSGNQKVVLKVSSFEELVQLFESAKREIPSVLIRDAGRTQIESNTATCIGLGPWNESKLNKFTGKLKLL